jgi:hypothetical protein
LSDNNARELRRDGRRIPDALIKPHADRMPAEDVQQILSAHRAAVIDGADGYVDPTNGLFSFTAAYHWAKGRCCELGCRHCPWLDADERMAIGPCPSVRPDDFGDDPPDV